MNGVEASRSAGEEVFGANQKFLIALTALAIVFDGIDNQLLGVAIPSIMQEWSAPRSAFAPVVSIGYFGMMLGAAIFGPAGDRIGRKTSLITSMIVFGAETALTALVSTPTELALLRLITSVGIGGALPNAAALAAEFVPARIRPLAVTLTIVCVPVGGTIAGLLGVRLLPVIGWKALFIVGGIVPVVYALMLIRLLPESPRFVRPQSGRWDDSIRALFAGETRRDTFALFAAFLSCLLAVYLGIAWLTSMLTAAGFDPATANIGITVFNIGGVVGALGGSVAIAQIGSRVSMIAMAVVAAVSAFLLSATGISASSMLFVMSMLTLIGGLINGVQVMLYALAAHIYPTAIRSTGVGTASFIGRTGAIISGYAGAWAIDAGGSASYFALIGVAMASTTIAVSFVRRHIDGSSRSLA